MSITGYAVIGLVVLLAVVLLLFAERVSKKVLANSGYRLETDRLRAETTERNDDVTRREREQKLKIEAMTTTEAVETRRAELQRAETEEWQKAQEALEARGKRLAEQQQAIGEKLAEKIPAPPRHTASVQSGGRHALRNAPISPIPTTQYHPLPDDFSENGKHHKQTSGQSDQPEESSSPQPRVMMDGASER